MSKPFFGGDKSFDWPTKDLFNKMDPSVYLKELRLKSSKGSVSFVQVVLSNGNISPAFGVVNKNQEPFKVLTFDRNKISKITSISSGKLNSLTYGAMKNLVFKNSEGEKVLSYGPSEENEKGQEIKLATNEELIGVYGTNNFHNFGFILKKTIY